MPSPPDPMRHDPTHRDTQIRAAFLAELAELGKSQRWLARQIERSPQWVSLKLSGMARLYDPDVQRLLLAFDAELVETHQGPKVINRQTTVV